MSTWKANWDAKYNTAAIKTILDTRRPDMLVNVGAALDEMQALENTIRACLAAHNINALFYGLYRSAALAMYGAKRKWGGGDTLDLSMAKVISDFTTMGLIGATLLILADEVFGWRPSVGP